MESGAHDTTQPPDPQILVIFGATGDLAGRKLFPGLFRLFRTGMLPADSRVIGSGRHSPGSDDEFRDRLGRLLRSQLGKEFSETQWAEFARRVTFVPSSADDGRDLATAVRKARQDAGEPAGTILYMSVPPGSMEPMIRMLGDSGLAEDAKVIMEKPFGRDLESSRSLNTAVHATLPEDRVFRIDHFLGKEAVQNILALRFANGLFEPVWNRNHIAYVQIDVPEDIGIEGRAAFMESTGTLRDMITTHLFQILGFVALEPPTRIGPEELRAGKHTLFQALRPLDPDRVVFGQYEGYRDEDGVDPRSTMETFVALEAWVDNWRWEGVPFLLRTGKAMGQSRRTVTVGFRDPPLSVFGPSAGPPGKPDELVFELTDEPVISLDVRAKVPGPSLRLAQAQMNLSFADAFRDASPLEAYERLLLDVMRDDQTLFTGSGEIERLWEVCEPVLRHPPASLPYPKGSWGPGKARDLTGDRGWRVPES
jgi:glucose-6-phosphate 1-dehydrogenase